MSIAVEGDRVTSTSHRQQSRWLVPVLLTCVYCAQCLWFVGTQSLTYDEPAHILAGLNAWRQHTFNQWNDQPPLARLLLTAPLIAGSWRITSLPQPLYGAFWTMSIRPSPERLAWFTRPVNVALGVVLAWLLWTAARRMFSEGAANFALALFAFSPPLIAHFSLATVDGALTLLLFATALTVAYWRHHPSWPLTLGLGGIIGLFLIAKFSALPIAALALVLMTTGARTVVASRRLMKMAAALAVGLTIVWAAYFFQTGDVTFRNGRVSGRYARGRTVVLPLSRPLDVTMRLPAPDFFAALGGVVQHNLRGQQSFFLGEVRKNGGWLLYFPAVSVLKWPPLVWALAGATLVLIFSGLVPAADFWLIMMFPAALFGLSLLSNVNIGDRYVLPIYPFLLLACAGFWSWIKGRRWAVPLIAIIVAVQMADCFRYAPDYLSYFMPLVSPARSRTLLTDSNLDWGQGLIALRRYQHEHPTERVSLAYFGTVDPGEYGICASPLGEEDRPTGTVVVSATHLSGQYLHNSRAYQWLLKYPLKAILNHSLYVFDVPGGVTP
jgi:dolichyl-phosphate-mannose-protein mannosyltransferase